MREKAFRVLLALVLVAVLAGVGMNAYAQTGVGGGSGIFSRVWIVQDQGVTALHITQATSGASAITVSTDEGVSLLEVGGDGDWNMGTSPTGGNLGDKYRMFGVPNLHYHGCGAGTDASAETVSYADDSPTGEWAPIDATTTEAEASVAGLYYKEGASAYQMNWLATAVDGSGFVNNIVNDNLEADSYITILLYTSEPLAAGDLVLVTDDDTADTEFPISATPAGIWTQKNVDISSLAAGTGDVVEEIQIEISAAGALAHAAFTTYVDYMYKWVDTDKCLLNTGDTMFPDGILGVVGETTGTDLVGETATVRTDYFPYYDEAGTTDGIVFITNQSAQAGLSALVALEP